MTAPQMLIEVCGRYPSGGCWRVMQFAESLAEPLEIFRNCGVTSVKLIASTSGDPLKSMQRQGLPVLFLGEVL